jgi:hypothetical protein
LLKEAGPWRIPAPRRVYLGSRMPAGGKEQIAAICKRKGVELHQMYLADDSFCLRSELITAAQS